MNVTTGKTKPDLMSVYTAEIMAVIIGLQRVGEVRPDRVVGGVDSVAVLRSTPSMKSNGEDLMLEIRQSLFRFHRPGVEV